MEFLTKRQQKFYRAMEKTPLTKALLTDWFILKGRQKIDYYSPKIDEAIRNYKGNDAWLDDPGAVRNARREIIFHMFAYGILPYEYYMFRFRDCSPRKKDSFLTDKLTVANLHKLNDYAYLDLFNNKWKTYEKYGQFYGRKMVRIGSEEDRPVFDEFVKDNPVFVKKGEYGAMGRTVEKVDSSDYPSMDSLFAHLMAELNTLDKGGLILEELIHQSAKMASLNPSSVNTLRLMTLLGDDGEVIYKFPWMKIGRNGSFVDNGGSGGMFVQVDEKTGIVRTNGATETGEVYYIHPDSGTVIPGFQVPDWNQALELGRKLAPITPRVRYVGWDLAHTDKGWIVVEGNFASQSLYQNCDQMGRRYDMAAIVDNLKDLSEIPE
jgi:hypothetical protein